MYVPRYSQGKKEHYKSLLDAWFAPFVSTVCIASYAIFNDMVGKYLGSLEPWNTHICRLSISLMNRKPFNS